MASLKFKFKNGHWIWNKYEKGLEFISHEKIESKHPLIKKAIVVIKREPTEIDFREDVGLLDKIRFRKLHQRRSDNDEQEVIILQDVKDVAIFTAEYKNLTSELIDILHTQTIDKLLKALIVYFQYYLQVWEKLMVRRVEKKNRLMQPCVVELENLIRDDLSDLRSMVSCSYGAMVIGADDMHKFHHMANKNGASLSGKDRRIFKMVIKMILRIVWLALQRPNIALLELELVRLTSTDSFNYFVHQGKVTEKLQTTSYENQILQGTANVKEPRLLQHSPLGKEILLEDHDHRMLSIGIITFPPSDERQNFMELIYSAPEEYFSDYGLTVGILGLKRTDFDEMLVKKKMKKGRRKSKGAEEEGEEAEGEEEIEEEEEEQESEEEEDKHYEITFQIPRKIIQRDDTIPDAYPSIPPKFEVSEKTKKMIQRQCNMWKKVVERAHLGLPMPSISLI